MAGIQWKPGQSPRDLARRIQTEYGVDKHVAAAATLAKSFEPVLESAAKAEAPWTDRTGNARQGLFSVSDIEGQRVILYLSHGVEYGVYLELCNQGRYAIVLPTLERHYAIIKRALQDLYR